MPCPTCILKIANRDKHVCKFKHVLQPFLLLMCPVRNSFNVLFCTPFYVSRIRVKLYTNFPKRYKLDSDCIQKIIFKKVFSVSDAQCEVSLHKYI